MKKTAKIVATTAALVAVAGMAHAATQEMNIYGASAQFNFWKNTAQDYLGTGGLNCADAASAVFSNSKDGNHSFITAHNCNPSAALVAAGFAKGDDMVFRISKKASYDGIYAVSGVADGTLPDPHDPTLACQTANPFTRAMLKDATDGAIANTQTPAKCAVVTIGASDVAGPSFVQSSQGLEFGYKAYQNDPSKANYNPVYDRSVIFSLFGGVDTSATTKDQSPVVVPFGFYINKTVTYNGTPLTNLSRLQAVSLFSGGVKNWSDFGAGYVNAHATICMRHAGSGSHATLDYAVMNNGTWGTPLISTPNNANDAAAFALHDPNEPGGYNSASADVYFNDGTGDELNCVNNYNYAVGYADADAATSATASMTAKYPNIFPSNATGTNVNPIAYQGVYPSSDAIIHGTYDFWTKEHMYQGPAANAVQQALFDDMKTYASTPAHLTIGANPSYGNFWATAGQLLVTKGGDGFYPTR